MKRLKKQPISPVTYIDDVVILKGYSKSWLVRPEEGQAWIFPRFSSRANNRADTEDYLDLEDEPQEPPDWGFRIVRNK